jgi:hypothetical protein
VRELTRRKTDGDLAEQSICDHALFRMSGDPVGARAPAGSRPR